jgi:hypothetical protein
MNQEKKPMKELPVNTDNEKLERELRTNLPKLEERLARLKEAQFVSQELLKLEVSF